MKCFSMLCKLVSGSLNNAIFDSIFSYPQLNENKNACNIFITLIFNLILQLIKTR